MGSSFQDVVERKKKYKKGAGMLEAGLVGIFGQDETLASKLDDKLYDNPELKVLQQKVAKAEAPDSK